MALGQRLAQPPAPAHMGLRERLVQTLAGANEQVLTEHRYP
jgi:hypothetical protein